MSSAAVVIGALRINKQKFRGRKNYFLTGRPTYFFSQDVEHDICGKYILLHYSEVAIVLVDMRTGHIKTKF